MKVPPAQRCDDYPPVAGVFTLRDGVTLEYPFTKAILSALPFVNTMYLNDGGSEDATPKIYNKLQEMFPETIVITNIRDDEVEIPPNNPWNIVDEHLRQLIDIAEEEWILHAQADEFWALQDGDIDSIKNAVIKADSEGYNAIRQPRFLLVDPELNREIESHNPEEPYEVIRLVRNTDDLNVREGGDCFYRENEDKKVRDSYSSHNVPPELDIETGFYHARFIGLTLWRIYRQVTELAPDSSSRNRLYEEKLEKQDITEEELQQAFEQKKQGSKNIDNLLTDTPVEYHSDFIDKTEFVHGFRSTPFSNYKKDGPIPEEHRVPTRYKIPKWVFDKDKLQQKTGIQYNEIP